MDAQSTAEVELWLSQYAAASEQLAAGATASAAALWQDFDDWYDTVAVAALATQTAALSATAAESAAGLSSQYVASVVAAMQDTGTSVAPIVLPPPRNGADMNLIYTRPAEAFRKQIATGADEEVAIAAASKRLTDMVETDLMLAERDASRDQMAALGAKLYRRVIRPELSRSGTCGLCIAASDRFYTIADLMPIHDRCNCATMPIIGGNDPGRSLNADDLERIYSDAGGTAGDKLKRTRYQVNRHGELGPVLTRRGDSFRTRADVEKGVSPERAGRQITKLLPVLDGLEKRALAGENVSGPLAYQRDLLAKLRRTAGN